MKFETTNPEDERGILILCTDGDQKHMIQGQYYADEEDYYDWNGELLENVLGWIELPQIEL